VKTESATPPNQRDEAQNRDGVRENHPFFKTLLARSTFAVPTSPRDPKGKVCTLTFKLQDSNGSIIGSEAKIDNVRFLDTTSPAIATFSPADGATLATGSYAIFVTFSESVKAFGTGRPQSSSLVLTGAGATGALKGEPYLTNNNTWVFPVTFSAVGPLNLALGSSPQNIEDLAGNGLQPRSWSYQLAATPPINTVFNPANGHYYEYVPTSVTWPQAKAAAESRVLANGWRGHLATIQNDAENEFVRILSPVAGAWLGGFQPAESAEPAGNWQWLTGEPFSNYTKWRLAKITEPNNEGGNEDSLYMHGSIHGSPGTWNDANGINNTGGFVVEYEGADVPPSITASPASQTVAVAVH
jgi:hypothetical protein